MHGPWLFPCLPVSHFPRIRGFATENRAISQPRFKISEFENLLRKKKSIFNATQEHFTLSLRNIKRQRFRQEFLAFPKSESWSTQVHLYLPSMQERGGLTTLTRPPIHLLFCSILNYLDHSYFKKKMKSLKPKESFRVLKRV